MKKFVAILALVLCFGFTSAVASAAPLTSSPNLGSRLQALENAGGGTLVITDKATLEQIASDQGLATVPKKVEYEYQPAVATSSNVSPLSSAVASPAATSSSVYWLKTWDNGITWNSGDLYKSFTVDGPSAPGFQISESTKKSSTYTASGGAKVSVIEAKVGFTLNKEYSITWTDTTPIAKGETVTFNLYTKYHEVDYSVYYGPAYDGNHSICTGGGTARNPVGSYIQKIFK